MKITKNLLYTYEIALFFSVLILIISGFAYPKQVLGDVACVAPNPGNNTNVFIGTNSPDKPLQNIFNDAGYINNVSTEQKNYQTWGGASSSATFEVEYLDQSAGGGNVFGYYTNADISTFIPLFKEGGIANPLYPSAPIFSPGQKTSFTINAGQYVAFAINAQHIDGQNLFISTDDSKQGSTQVLSYNAKTSSGSLSGNFLLGFEDLLIPSGVSDSDYNDVVVHIHQLNCGLVTPPPPAAPVNHPPTLILTGVNPVIVTAGQTFTDPGATASDQEDGNITNKIVVTGSVNTAIVGTYTLTYNVTDSGGLSATSITRTINVVAPSSVNHAPVITLAGANPMTLALGQTFNDPGVTANDQEDGDVTGHILRTGSVNTALVGSYTLTYNVKDSAGLAAIPAIRTINVVSTPPASTTLHVVTQVINNNGGTAAVSSFNIQVKLSGTNVTGSPSVGAGTPGTSYPLSAGTYVVNEDANGSYSVAFSGDCDATGNIVLASGDNKTCTIINDDVATVVVTPPPSSGGGPLITPPGGSGPLLSPPVQTGGGSLVTPVATGSGPLLTTSGIGLPNTGAVQVVNKAKVPGFPKTGFAPFGENNPWNIAIILGDAAVFLVSLYIVLRKKTA